MNTHEHKFIIKKNFKKKKLKRDTLPGHKMHGEIFGVLLFNCLQSSDI